MSDDDATVNQTLALLGLTGGNDPITAARSARAYLLAVRQGSLSPVDLHMIGIPPAQVPGLVAGLISRGLLITRGPDLWEASPPNLVLPLIAKDLEQQASLIRSTAPELAQIYFGTRTLSTDHHIEGIAVMSSMEELDTASALVVGEAQQRLRVLRGPSPRTDFLLDAQNAGQHVPAPAPDERALEISSVYDSSLLERDGIMDVLSVRRRGGEMIRVSPNVPFSVVIADDEVAVVDLTRYASTGGNSLLIRSRPVVLALGALCDLMWRTASPVFSARTALVSPDQVAPSGGAGAGMPGAARPDKRSLSRAKVPPAGSRTASGAVGSASAAPGGSDAATDQTSDGPSIVMALDKRDRRILSLLAAGASDATIARQTQISQRTVERRIRTLLDQLGATTRFQAGAQAVRRGWI